MLLPQEPLSGKGLIEATFRLEDLPDARLFRRLETLASGMLRSGMHERDERPQPTKRAERRGAARLYANERIDSDLLASRAQQRCAEAIAQLPSVIVAHDTAPSSICMGATSRATPALCARARRGATWCTTAW